MKKTTLNLVLIFITINLNCYANNITSENIVKAYIEARNTYDVKKINELIDEKYQETFIDGSVEIENKQKLIDLILWDKELDSQIKLIEIRSEGENVITTEENTNYLDIALKRKKRQFKTIYKVIKGKIKSGKVDVIKGHDEIAKFNSIQFEKFMKFCEQNKLGYNTAYLNGESGKQLRALLEIYINKGSNKENINEKKDNIKPFIKVYTSLEEALQNPKKVYKLDLSFKKITEIPHAILEFKNLEELNLSNTKIKKLPSFISELSELKILIINNHGLKTLPESIGKMKKLTRLELGAGIMEILPKSIGRLEKLENLNLLFNEIKELPESFGNLKNLKKLEIRSNKLKTLPNSFGNLSNLREVNLHSNELTTLPKSFGNLRNIELINLGFNKLKKIPLLYFENLKVINIRENEIQTIIRSMKTQKNLLKLDLRANNISNKEILELERVMSKCTIIK